MKIGHVKVSNFRSLKDVALKVDDYSVFVGTNGSGKSSILYALDWFFTGYSLDVGDVHRVSEGGSREVDSQDGVPNDGAAVKVTVTFTNLSSQDRTRLHEYGRGENAIFTRVWRPEDQKSKVIGNALAGPGFASLRAMTRVTDLRSSYIELRSSLEDLADLPANATKENILQSLADWESSSDHLVLLEAIDESDANHMFGINGPNVIRECIRLVLIPAATDITNEVGGVSKGSALSELIGSLMSDAGASARTKWIEDNQSKIEELHSSVKSNINEATKHQTDRINTRLSAFVPNTFLELHPVVPDWTPKGDATVTATVNINGIKNDVSKQGHGIQRALLIAMFQSQVPDEESAAASHTINEEETSDEAHTRLENELANLPVLVVAIEEPEIYQHPIRARAFARVLADLAIQPKVQVILATHSPYFVRPQQFESLRRFRLIDGETSVLQTDLRRVASAASCGVDQAEKIITKRLPNTFAEGFFADAVVLVEGDTDKMVLETIAEKCGTPLDMVGISILDMSGKDGLAVPYGMLLELKIPTYVLVDGDALGAARKYGDLARRAESHASHRRSTEAIYSWLPTSSASISFGALPYNFEDPTVVTDLFTLWEDDIEEELSNWPTYLTALRLNGSNIRDKNLLNYRTAILEADLGDIPVSLAACISAITNFA